MSLEPLLRSRLAGLLLQHFTRIANALLLVGIGLAQPPDVPATCPTAWRSTPVTVMCVCLSMAMSIRPESEHDRMNAQCEYDLLALDLGAIADADDVEILAEALGYALDGVGDQARARPWNLPSCGSSRSSRALTCRPRARSRSGGQRLPQGALGPLISTRPGWTSILTPFGTAIGFFPMRDCS